MLLKDLRFLTSSEGGLYLISTSAQSMRTYACSTAHEELHEETNVACLYDTPKFYTRVSPASPTLFLVMEREPNKLLEVSADTLAEVRSLTFNDVIVRVQCSDSFVVVFARGQHRASVHSYRISPSGALDPCPPDLLVSPEAALSSCISLGAPHLAVTTCTVGTVSVADLSAGTHRDVNVSSTSVCLAKLSGGFLVTADERGLKLKLWDPQAMGKPEDRLAVFRIATNLGLDPTLRVLDVAVSANGAFLVATTSSKYCFVFDVEAGREDVRKRQASWVATITPWDAFTTSAAMFTLDGAIAAATVKEVAFDASGNLHVATNQGSYGLYSVSRAADGRVAVQLQPRFTNSIL